MLRKELVTSRLSKFDEYPGHYKAWKSTFMDVVDSLDVSPSEQIDLLIKWLGPESSKYARSVKSVCISDANNDLRNIWLRLDKRYGSPEISEHLLLNKIEHFPKLTNKDHQKLWELTDLLTEIEAAKRDPELKGLGVFDTANGMRPVIEKLPYNIQEKWISLASRHKKQYNATFPLFGVFADFIRDIADTRNDPSFMYISQGSAAHKDKRSPLSSNMRKTQHIVCVNKTELPDSVIPRCPLHKTGHRLNDCRGFRGKPLNERKQFLKEKGLCFRCCETTEHMSRECKVKMKCSICSCDTHPSALHIESKPALQSHGGEPDHGDSPPNASTDPPTSVTSNCLEICSEWPYGRSCAKIVQVNVYAKGDPDKTVLMYAILDDQSNRSLASAEFFDLFDVQSENVPYSLHTCGGSVDAMGRRASGYIVESADGATSIEMPTIIECDRIPNNRNEIPTPEAARCHTHLKPIADFIPEINDNAEILLLIGRDVPEAHHVHEQCLGPRNAPFAQRLSLGWALIGEMCLGKIHNIDSVSVYRTNIIGSNRPSLFPPCPSLFNVKERPAMSDNWCEPSDNLGDTVFKRTKDDEIIGMSIEDKLFLEMMDKEFTRSPSGNWVAPLPFRSGRCQLPSNKAQAANRAKTLDRSLKRDPTKREHFTSFMQTVICSGHAELAPPVKSGECWYLPIFGVYHPRKPDQIRAVFDSSAKHRGISLNDVLLSGPDLTNNLLGILLRFRKKKFAVTADIQQMFYGFMVKEGHKDFLRFLWYRDNDPSKELAEYRMCVHVFGNRPSLAVATYGLRRIAENSVETFGSDVRDFVNRNFYVDDGLISLPTEEQAVDLMKRTQEALKHESNLRLHKIASNSEAVMKSFSTDDLAKNLKDFDLKRGDLPLQRSLGLIWDLSSDVFKYQVESEQKPYTRRGVLSTVNSLFDPIGFLAPITVQGKLILRELMADVSDWDQPLPHQYQSVWQNWRDSLDSLKTVEIPRMYVPESISSSAKRELHIFSDASEKAIAAVAYLRTTTVDDRVHVGFVMGKSKVAPKHGHTIPRLELCAAVLAVEISETLSANMDIDIDLFRFYKDSKVVLGYIHNQKRRFYTYVTNRIDRIRRSTEPSQWSYVHTDSNPADCATRSVPVSELVNSRWLCGPRFLLSEKIEAGKRFFSLEDPDKDNEIRPCVDVFKTHVKKGLGSHRFGRFSTWKALVETFARLIHIASSYHETNHSKGWHMCQDFKTVKNFTSAERFIIRVLQHEVYDFELKCLSEEKPLPKRSKILSLKPVIDENNMLRVGGRINRAEVNTFERNPLIIPAAHHVATLLVRHYHERIKHQGRHFTEGALRAAGLWIVGGKRLISSVLSKCVKCRKLRRKPESQPMSDLPADRLIPSPPFTNVGVDTFGPWSVVARRTRGGVAHSKRWAVIFTCLTIRAVHIEVVEDLSSAAFVNALRRFIAIRGNVKQLRSDRGTNFVGSTGALKINAINVEDGPMQNFLYDSGVVWIFNPPHSSHMGGTWERMIGVTRRILDSILNDMDSKNLTHDVLSTLMYEVSAIINARPITPVSSDPGCPQILSPQMLLTQKCDEVAVSTGTFDMKDIYRSKWKLVQMLADRFWKRWRNEYLHTLQSRRKWQTTQRDVTEGDVVLLSDKNIPRNDWSVGIVKNAIPSKDGRVRKAEIRVVKDGKTTVYTRPISDLVVLVEHCDV